MRVLDTLRSSVGISTILVPVILGAACWSVQAEVFTVGPHGQVAEISQAIDLALATVDNDQIRVEGPGVYSENLMVSLDSSTGNLSISGAWDATFTTQSGNSGSTVIDGAQSGRVIDCILAGGTVLYVGHLTLRNGRVEGVGGGMVVSASSGSELFAYDLWFFDNEALSTDAYGGQGGGIYVSLNDAYAEVNGNRFEGNTVGSPSADNSQPVSAGGAYLRAFSGTNSDLEFADNFMSGNGCVRGEELGSANACSVEVEISGLGNDLSFKRNTVRDTVVNGFAQVNVVAGWISVVNSASGILENNRWEAYSAQPALTQGNLLRLDAHSGGEITQRSSLVALGPEWGQLVAASSGSWYATNLTVTKNGSYGIGVSGDASSSLELSNTLVWDHAIAETWVASGASLVEVDNLLGSDPLFVNANSGFYQLQMGSPAVDAGSSAPTGGLSAHDLDGNRRVQGSAVDLGAYEGTDMIFSDGFESGTLAGWS